MPDIDLLAVVVATGAAFVAGGVYYALLGEQLAQVSEAAAEAQPAPWTFAVELLRCLVLAAVVAGLVSRGSIDELSGGILLALALWIGFPLVLWTGAIVHENAPWKLATIHAGDWLAKLLLIGAIVAVME